MLNDAYTKKQNVYNYTAGVNIAGDYWIAICEYLRTNGYADVDYGTLIIHQLNPLLSLRADCLHMIEKIEKEESDRKLSRLEKEANIRYGLFGLIISIIALIISIVAIVLETKK